MPGKCALNQIVLLVGIFNALFINQGFSEIALNDAIAMYMEDAITDVKLRIHKSAQRQHGNRYRRSIGLSHMDNLSSPAYELQLDSIVPIQSVPTSHPVRLSPFKIGNEQYLTVVNFKSLSGDFKTVSEIYKMVNGSFSLLQQFPTTGCVDFEYAKLSMESYAIFVENRGTNWLGQTSYSKSFHLFKYLSPNFSGKEFDYSASVGMQGGKAVKTFIHKNRNYFVAANSFSNDGNKHNTKSSLYLKTQFGFLLVQQFETQGAQDVEVFVIGGLIYLAFANYNDNEQRVDIYSTIYREKLEKNADNMISFEYAQRILTHGAKDFEYFYFRNNHYLAVANEVSQLITYNTDSAAKNFTVTNDYEVDSVIYWWSGKFFVEWQRIPTNGAVKWSSFAGPNGAIMLVVANTRAQAVIYTYDITKGLFKPTSVQGLHPFPGNWTLPDVRSVEAFNFANETYLAVANFKRRTHTGYNIFKLNFALTPTASSQVTLADALTSPLNILQKKLDELKMRLTSLKNALSDIMTVDSIQTVHGIKTFKNLRSENVKTNSLIYSQRAENNPVEKAVQQAMTLRSQLSEHSKRISKLKERLEDSVTRTGSQYVAGTKTFTQHVEFADLSVNEMKAGFINKINITDLARRTWSKTKNQTLYGNYHFMQDIQAIKDVNIKGSVNGILIPDDVMTRNTRQYVTGKKMFKNNFMLIGNITTDNFTINGMDIPNDIVLKSISQQIFGPKELLGDIKFSKSIVVDGTVNKKKLSEFSRKVVTLSTDQTIRGKKTFLDGFKIQADLNVAKLVDGVNLTYLSEDSVRLDTVENIKGVKRIAGSVKAKKDLWTLSTTNGYRLQNDIMTTHTDQTINSKKDFFSFAVEGNVKTTSTVDGIYLYKESVGKSNEEAILGPKTFQNNLTFNANIEVSGTVDGVDVSNLQSTSAKINANNSFISSKVFTGKVTVLKQMSISNNINNINLQKLRDDILMINGNQTINAPFVFESMTVLSNLNINGTVNGVEVPKHLYVVDADEKTFNNVTFLDEIVVNDQLGLSANSKLNGRVLPTFASNVMLQGINQTIHGDITFKKELLVERQIEIAGHINGVKLPGDFLTLNAKMNVNGRKTFLGGIYVDGNLSTSIINVSMTVNDVDVSQIVKHAVYCDEMQTVNGSMTILGNVTSKKGIIVGNLVDHVNITELSKTVVRISVHQRVNGHKIFSNDTIFYQPLNTAGKVNNISLVQLETNALKKSGNKQIVSGIKTFINSVNIAGNVYNGTINGIDLEEFNDQLVWRYGNQSIKGQLTFLDSLGAQTMMVTGKLDEITLDNLMLTYGNQITTGYMTFTQNSTFRQNIEVKDTVNMFNLTVFSHNLMKIDGDQNISAFFIFKKDISVIGNIFVEGFVNSIDISKLNATVVRRNGSQEIIGEKKFLENIAVEGDAFFMHSLNGINISHLLSDVMLKSEEQMICSEKIFSSNYGMNIVSKLTVSNMDASHFVDNVNVTDLNQTAVKLNENQKLHGDYNFFNHTRFLNNVDVKGFVNGINVSDDVMTNNENQVVQGYKIFKKLQANSNINLTGKVDGCDVSEFAKSRVTLSTGQKITGMKKFQSNITVAGNMQMASNATVNDINIGEELLQAGEQHMIVGEKTFEKDITVMGNFSIIGNVNGINISNMKDNILLIDKKNTLTGINTFTKDIKVEGSIIVYDYINGLKIGKIFNISQQLETRAKTRLDTLNITSDALCQKIRVLTSVAGVEVIFRGIEKIGQFSKEKLGQVHAFNVGSIVFVTIARLGGSGCGPAYILRCNPSLSCVTHQIIMTRAVSMQSYQFTGKTYIFVGHWGANTSGCTSFPELLKFDVKTSRFISHYIITTSLLDSIGRISTNKVITKNLLALIPSFVLTSILFKSPITDLGSILTQRTAITKIFTSNRTTFLVTASVLVDIYYIELFILNTSSLQTTKIQQITTREVSSLDIGIVNNSTMLAVAEGRHGSYRDIKIYTFIPKRHLFFFYQRIVVAAVSVTFSDIHTRHYLIFASPEHGFGLCPWRGVIGFGKCWSVPDVGIRYIHTIVTIDGVFAVGTTDSQMVSYKAIFQGLVPPYNGTIIC